MQAARCFTVTLLYSALAIAATASATAPVKFEDGRVTVSYSDLNIHSADGARSLYARLQRASKAACGKDALTTLGSVRRTAAARACYADTLDSFVSRIDSEALKSLHAG